MELNEYQEQAYKTSVYKDHHKIGGLTYTVLALGGEAGELANVLKKALRKGAEPDAVKLIDELGDVLWYASAVATELGTTLEDVARWNLAKVAARHAAGKRVG